MADTIDILNIQPNKVTKDLKGKYYLQVKLDTMRFLE